MNLYMQTTLTLRKPYAFISEEEVEQISAEILSCPGFYSDELPIEFHEYFDHYEGYIGAGADKTTILGIQDVMANAVRELSNKFPKIEFVLQHEITGDHLTASAELKFLKGE